MVAYFVPPPYRAPITARNQSDGGGEEEAHRAAQRDAPRREAVCSSDVDGDGGGQTAAAPGGQVPPRNLVRVCIPQERARGVRTFVRRARIFPCCRASRSPFGYGGRRAQK